MTDQLSIYNDALYILGSRPLATLTDNVEPRRALDQFWTDARNHCLQAGHWKFAHRTVKIDYNSAITPDFGYSRAFTIPSDYVRLSAMCYDEFLKMPITLYTEEAGSWFTEVDEIYVKYVSNDSSYGYDFSRWPATFSYFVSAYLAFRGRRRIMPSRDADEVKNELEEARDNALFKDSVEGPTQFPPHGSWVGSRLRGYPNSRRNERSPQGPSN